MIVGIQIRKPDLDQGWHRYEVNQASYIAMHTGGKRSKESFPKEDDNS